jgi:hypothetical protein
MQCKNHPEVLAADRCAGCAEPFCGDCLVNVGGKNYCGACKVLAIQGQPAIVEEATLPCKEADEALKYAIVGLLCCGIILCPIGISKALNAKKMIALNPRLTGAGKATAALIIGWVGLALFVLGMIAKFSQMNH